MHTEHEDRYDAITRIAAAFLDVPIILISLVGRDHQWFLSQVGIGATQTPRNTSFCAFTFLPVDPKKASMFVIEDARTDPRVENNPLVAGEPGIVFYAGCPIVTSDGLRLGALCAIDKVPRSITGLQAQVLVNLCSIVAQEIESVQLGQNVPEDDGFADVSFAAGPYRRERMCEALSELVCMVQQISYAKYVANTWL